MEYVVILAGGSGTRLWPLSRRTNPKQVRALFNDRTLLQATADRLRGQFPPEAILCVTLADQLPSVTAQLPDLSFGQLIVEPVGRDTAAAIGYAAARLLARDPDAIITTVNSDAYVRDAVAYATAIRAAQETAAASDADVVLVGLQPTGPETGYGYIEVAGEVGREWRWLAAHPVERFIEKPDRVTAEHYVASGRHLWNPALFTFRADRLLARYAEHLPEHAAAFAPVAAGGEITADVYANLPRTSIDYGLMEKLTRLVVLPASFGWTDVGNWRTVHEVLADQPNTNGVRGTHVGLGGDGNLIIAPSGKVVATYGLTDMVVIDTPDALLVCPRVQAHGVKEVVAELEQRGMTEYL